MTLENGPESAATAVQTPATTDVEMLTLPETVAAPVPAAPEQLVAPDLNILPTVLDDLKRMRATVGAGAEPVNIPIPGFQGKLVGRFQWVSPGALAATAKSLRAIKDPTEQQLAAIADALVATNCGILVQVDGKLESLQHEGLPVTFENGAGIALALGLPRPNSARECVESVFGNPYGMVDVGTKVMTWLEDTSKGVDEEYLGE